MIEAVEPKQSPAFSLDWERISAELDRVGWALTGTPLLSAAECDSLIRLYDDEARFRSRVVMSRHGFGQGEYKYFAYPLPQIVERFRSALYEPLRAIANDWQARLGNADRFPATLDEFRGICHKHGQQRPTPLLLRYGAGDYNCLHQDIYGELAFPLQVALLLSVPGADFFGGEFVLTEQRPRMQSRAHVVPLTRGEAVIFAVRERPVKGTRGDYKVSMRHGVSQLRAGSRHVLGIIFHDAT